MRVSFVCHNSIVGKELKISSSLYGVVVNPLIMFT